MAQAAWRANRNQQMIAVTYFSYAFKFSDVIFGKIIKAAELDTDR